MRAVVDLGSNSFKYLVAERSGAELQIVSSASRVTRLAEGVTPGGKLGHAALERARQALLDFATELSAASVDTQNVRVVATAAARQASNSFELACIVKDTLGQSLRVINGNEEAALSLRGAMAALRQSEANCDGVDSIEIGGASTQITLDSGNLVTSFDLGGVRAIDALGISAPLSQIGFQKAELAIPGCFPDLDAFLQHQRRTTSKALVVIGGSMLAAARMVATDSNKKDQLKFGMTIELQDLHNLCKRISVLDLAARRSLPGMEPGREDIIVPSLLMTSYLARKMGYSKAFFTSWGLRHGLLLDDASWREE